ncbi:hypothetical protein F4802DRAFT_556501 [Xylaria palmicola]|nr:hypothetical protein F4802DRAFT_556501 [Xylaria palmicola]
MPLAKKERGNPTRRQPPRATRNPSRKEQTEGEAAKTSCSLPAAGVAKREGKSRGATTRRRKKLQSALIKRIEARNYKDALFEQGQLLGLAAQLSPTSPAPSHRGRRHGRAEKKYMDDLPSTEHAVGDGLQRGQRWIPDFEHRTRPTHQPHAVPFSLWLAYRHLDDYIYRHSLSQAEVEALPLLEDVHEYQNSDGRGPKPITPPGYQWDKNLELVPLEE